MQGDEGTGSGTPRSSPLSVSSLPPSQQREAGEERDARAKELLQRVGALEVALAAAGISVPQRVGGAEAQVEGGSGEEGIAAAQRIVVEEGVVAFLSSAGLGDGAAGGGGAEGTPAGLKITVPLPSSADSGGVGGRGAIAPAPQLLRADWAPEQADYAVRLLREAVGAAVGVAGVAAAEAEAQRARAEAAEASAEALKGGIRALQEQLGQLAERSSSLNVGNGGAL